MIHLLEWLVGFVAVCALVGRLYQRWGTRRDAKVYPPPGRLVDVGGHRLHIHESGPAPNGDAPTILLEAGLMSTVLSWSGLQEALSRYYRVVRYDRAGLGWSDPGPMPRTAERIVRELHTLLDRAKIPGPYILVGHSFGGLTMPLFAARFPREVAGVVLVDPVAPAEWNPPSDHDLKQTRTGAKICRRAAVFARFGVLRFITWLLLGNGKKIASRLVRLLSSGSPADSGTVASPWFAALPENERNMAAVFWVQPKFALTIASQLENLPANAALLDQTAIFTDKPVAILTARTAPERRRREHAAAAARLPQGEHILAENSNHWIMQQEPELVIRAIDKIVASYSEKARPALFEAAAQGK